MKLGERVSEKLRLFKLPKQKVHAVHFICLLCEFSLSFVILFSLLKIVKKYRLFKL